MTTRSPKPASRARAAASAEAQAASGPEEAARHFDTGTVVGSFVGENAAVALTDAVRPIGVNLAATLAGALIGAGTEIEGNISFSGGLRVDGHVRGNVISAEDKPGTLVLSDQARIEGEIRVSHLVVNGSITGPVYTTEFLELQSRSKLTGDVHYNTLEMHLGAS
mgnify:CR=1 FL=1